MQIYITPDGTWGNAEELILIDETQLEGDSKALTLYKELWEGCEADRLYNYLWERVK